jgi:hypothetical protein
MSISRKRSRWPDLLAAWFASCLLGSTPGLARAGEDDRQALERIRGEIEALVAANRRCHNVVHCHLLSMGFDACGHPTLHVAFNDFTGAKATLEAKGAEMSFLEEELLRGTPRPANCVPYVLPKPACHRHQCSVGVRNE